MLSGPPNLAVFFCGDGCLSILRNGKRRGGITAYVARASIVQRLDDIAVLQAIHARIGGNIHIEAAKTSNGYVSKPIAVWRVSSRIGLYLICDILDSGVLPFKKKQQVALMREYLAVPYLPGPKADADRQAVLELRARLCDQFKAMHRYDSVDLTKFPQYTHLKAAVTAT